MEEPDEPMTLEQEAIAAALEPEMVARIDAAILACAKQRNRKVTMLVGLVMMDSNLRVPGLPDIYYAQRVMTLVSRGLLVAEGNLAYMRYSEVRLPNIASTRTRLRRAG